MIPLLVTKNLLLSANALFGMGIYASIFMAYALSGPILLLLEKTNIFYSFNRVFFMLAGIFAYLIKVKKEEHET